MLDYAAARHNMVECQVRPNKVTDSRLIAALQEIPRELFLPKARRSVAYVDEDVQVDGGRFLMEPMILARLLQAASVRARDIALDVGCATGYSVAILARICDTVVALESDHDAAVRAGSALTELGIDNAAVIEVPLETGFAKQAPYDVIVFGGAVARIPDAIAAQLAEGGRMVAVIDDGHGIGVGTVLTRWDGVLSGRPVFEASTPFLPGFEAESGFEF